MYPSSEREMFNKDLKKAYQQGSENIFRLHETCIWWNVSSADYKLHVAHTLQNPAYACFCYSLA